MDKLTALCKAMITYDKGDPRRIHHFLKVHAFAAQIGREEGLDEKTLFLLEAAAYVHDIGIHEGERRFGRNDGQIQQELGPDEARPMLEELGFERKMWIVSAGWWPIIIPMAALTAPMPRSWQKRICW